MPRSLARKSHGRVTGHRRRRSAAVAPGAHHHDHRDSGGPRPRRRVDRARVRG
ncbi:hypothetical protein ACFPRL_28505 [Pseudoclavibacter helvolus]